MFKTKNLNKIVFDRVPLNLFKYSFVYTRIHKSPNSLELTRRVIHLNQGFSHPHLAPSPANRAPSPVAYSETLSRFVQLSV
jgi:hypothetical protein